MLVTLTSPNGTKRREASVTLNYKVMKAKITYVERQWFSVEREIEISKADFNKVSKLNTEDAERYLRDSLGHDMCGDCGDEYHDLTEVVECYVEPLNK